MTKTIATICARGGSQGLPNKNILDFCGKPLIVHTIEQALQCSIIDRVVVSTDSHEIADIATHYGAEVPFIRPSELATSEAGKLPVIEHCLEFIQNHGDEVSKIIDLQPTSPLRIEEDILSCYNLLSDDVDVVFSVCETKHNPYFSLVELDHNNNVNLVKKKSEGIERRQDSPSVYALNGAVYVWHSWSLAKGLWKGKSRIHIMPKERSIDIDDQYDFECAELLFNRSNK